MKNQIVQSDNVSERKKREEWGCCYVSVHISSEPPYNYVNLQMKYK